MHLRGSVLLVALLAPFALLALVALTPVPVRAQTVVILPVQVTRGVPSSVWQRVLVQVVRNFSDSGVNTILPIEDPDRIALNLRSCNGSGCVDTTLETLGAEFGVDITVTGGANAGRDLNATVYFDESHRTTVNVALGSNIERGAADLVALVLAAHQEHQRVHPAEREEPARVATEVAASPVAVPQAAPVAAGAANTASTDEARAATTRANDGDEHAARRHVSAWNFIIGGALLAGGVTLAAIGGRHVARDGECVDAAEGGFCRASPDGRTFETYASGARDIAFIAVGAVAAIGGVVMFAARPIRVAAAPTRDGASVVVSGRF